jgi:catechol 2,3-dioxygenase-like lactoylglutathione lyase family enzyme
MSSPRSPFDDRGLHNRLNRISHFDVNVSNLERSRQWYEKATALRVVAETGAAQAFPSLGIEHGSFTGYMMKDKTQAGNFPMIHLVQWQDPAPVGTPYLSHANVGWYRIVPQVANVDAARQAVIAAGSQPFAPNTDTEVSFHPDMPIFPYNVFAAHDPDGITVEFSNTMFETPLTPITVAHNTIDIDKHFPFYVDTLGLDFVWSMQNAEPVPNVYSPGGGLTQCDGALLAVRGDRRVMFDWLEWTESKDHPTPYQEPTHLGIMRGVLEVDDIDTSYEILRRSEWAKERPLVLGPPEEWNFGEQFGTHKVLTFTDPLGVGFQLIQQPTSPYARLHPHG